MDQITVKERVSKLEDTLNGNGNPGIKTDIALIKKEQIDMNENLEKIATAYSALAKSQIEQDVIKKHHEENREKRSSAVKQVGTIFGIAFGVLGALYLILDHIG